MARRKGAVRSVTANDLRRLSGLIIGILDRRSGIFDFSFGIEIY
jgi:hypothetical protein